MLLKLFLSSRFIQYPQICLHSDHNSVKLLSNFLPSSIFPLFFLFLTFSCNFAFSADAAATFFNSNPRLVLDIASPIIEDTAATVSRALAARALGALTKEELLP